jgi:hypothetical protein
VRSLSDDYERAPAPVAPHEVRGFVLLAVAGLSLDPPRRWVGFRPGPDTE